MESAICVLAGVRSMILSLCRVFAASVIVLCAACLPGPLWGQTATGGTVTFSGGYEIHTFTASGNFTLNTASAVPVLVVAGGGGAGAGSSNNWGGGGGGAGGVVYSSSFSVNPGSYTVTVG